MGMDESMTKQETKEMMEQLEKVFSIVRILDVEGFETANSLRKKKMPDNPCQCYSFWNRDKRCENCISARVLADKKQRTKIEDVYKRQLVCIISLATATYNPFIYFRF